MLALIAEPVAEIAQQAVSQGLSTLAQTLLGSICVVCLGVAVLAVWKMINVQDKVVDRLEKANQLMAETNNKMVAAFSKFEITINGLIESQKRDQELQKEMTNVLTGLKSSVQTLVAISRDAGSKGKPPGTAIGKIPTGRGGE